MRRPIHLAAVLAAICAVALMLAACGGSDDGTRSSPTPATSAETSPGPASEAVKGATGSTPEQHAKAGKQQGTTEPGGSTAQADPEAAPTPSAGKSEQGQSQQTPQTQTAPKPVHVKGCPIGMSKSQCAELGKSYEQQVGGDSGQVVEANECPSAMSESECEAAGNAYKAAQGSGHVVQPGECPRAMTEEQCIEVGKAYEEATK